MHRRTNNESGFSLVELILTLLIIVAVVFGGYYIYSTQHRPPVKTVTTAKLSTVYAVWKSYTLEYAKISFKYPAIWKLNDSSNNPSSGLTNSDSVTLVGPNDFNVSINTGGLGHPSGINGPSWVSLAQPVSYLGSKGYIDYVSYPSSTNQNLSDGLADMAYLSQSPTNYIDTFASSNPGDNSGTKGNLLMTAGYVTQANGSTFSETVAQAKNDPNFQDFKLIIQSMVN